MLKPTPAEYIPAAARYVDLVPEGNLMDQLAENMTETVDFFSAIPEDRQTFRYAEGKWTPKQLLVHISDAERVFAFRALTLGRGDTTAVFPNMDENIYGAHVDPTNRQMLDITYEFAAVRMASIYLFNNFTSEQLRNQGNLFGYPVTPYGFAYILIGHTLHHMKIIRERYLDPLQ